MNNYKSITTDNKILKKLSKYPTQDKLHINRIPDLNEINFLSLFPEINHKNILNIFEKLNPSETQHSMIIGGLLNPRGEHGQGDFFLRIFLSLLSIPLESSDKWFVTVEKERFDIRINNKQKTKIIIIENKSNWAEDQQNQLYRYWYYGIYLAQSNIANHGINCFGKIIYLSPSAYKEPEFQSICRPHYFDKKLPEKLPIPIDVVFFHKEIVQWLQTCLGKIDQSCELYYYVNQYMKFWSK